MRVKPSTRLTLKDKLSRLTLVQAQTLLGPNGDQLLAKGGAIDIDLLTQVLLTDEWLQVTFPDDRGKRAPHVVTLALDDSHRDRLRLTSSHSGAQAQLHRAATLSLILEEKSALRLAAPPEDDVPWELLPESALESRALTERANRAAEEKMTVKPTAPAGPWTDYIVSSALSGKTYRVALRGVERGQSYCSCPDFRKNLLGTCKHVMKVQAWVQKKFSASDLATQWLPERFGVFARYDGNLRLGLEAPARLSSAAKTIVNVWRNRFAAEGAELVELVEAVRKLSRLGEEVTVYPDAEEILEQALHRHRMSELVAEIRMDPAKHSLRRELLLVELLPYQLDGIAFAAGRERAVLADEMGLGKTIQRQERVAEAGGQLLAAAFSLLGEMLPASSSGAPAPETIAAVKTGLRQCMQNTEDGKIHLAVTLPGVEALDGLAAALARLIQRGQAYTL